MEKLAEALILAAELREESFDHVFAREQGNKIFNFSECYKLSLEDAVDKAAEIVGFDKRANQPICLLLKNSWNEALNWANHYNDKE